MADTISTEREFERRQKVVAAVDLPGVPAGTFGKIWYAAGVTWMRYHVQFDNGVELSNVDGGDLRDRKAYLAEQREAEQERLAAEREELRARRREELLAELPDEPVTH